MGNPSQTGNEVRPTESALHGLRVKLDRLMRVKTELWEECQPIPPELEAKIREIRKALGLELPADEE
ncbi:MAG: hypothetical protein K8U57_17640 [Planctomycetes bacterium]|nr:hypothetical protein [Planctomycetota bacterium]